MTFTQAEIKPNDASLKAYKRIFAPEAPLPQHAPSTPLSMRFVKDRVQALLSSKTDLIVETGACAPEALRTRACAPLSSAAHPPPPPPYTHTTTTGDSWFQGQVSWRGERCGCMHASWCMGWIDRRRMAAVCAGLGGRGGGQGRACFLWVWDGGGFGVCVCVCARG